MRLGFAAGNGRHRPSRLAGAPWRQLLWGVLTAIALAAIVLASNLQPGSVTLSLGDTASRVIRAPVTAKYVSRGETARLRREAEERVTPVYAFNPYARREAQDSVDLAFDLLLEYKRQPSEELRSQLLSQFPRLEASNLDWARQAPATALQAARQAADNAVQLVMARDIRDNGRDLERARLAASRQASELAQPAPARGLVAAITQQALVPNSNYDAAATNEAREQARSNIKPRQRMIMVGDPIIYAGERVTEEHLDMLRAVGLINPRLDWLKLAATVGVCGLLVLLLGMYIAHHLPEVYRSRRQLVLVSLVLVCSLLTIYAVRLRGMQAEHLSMLTVAGGAMAVGLLLDVQLGVVVAAIQSMLLGTMANGQLSASALALGSALAGLCLVPRIWPPTQAVRAALLLGVANVVLVAGAGWLTGQEPLEVGSQMTLGGLYGVGAVVVAIGLVFLLQRPFEVVTSIRLLELADPNHPLLKRLMVEAPGSYSDSFMVANLAEGAAEAAGANGLLARVGAYYHDIGKLRRPYFFYENQALLGMGNVHDDISPSLSSLVITAHVRDGVELARQAGLPLVVQDIIAQHHGTTLIRFFYHRALTSEGGERLPEEMFRYPGPLPQTKEAAIVMLADSVFAAVWSLPEKTPGRIEQVVREVMDDRLADGQLNESPLTLHDLQVIGEHFLRILKNVLLHTRIEYPDIEAFQRNGRVDQEPAAPRGRPEAAADHRKEGPGG